ncbi:putative transmembrane reductase CYB561D1 [Gouania willdenowi]|uniref:ascorbate ferrireductase (transmembrane) n=1 Tax=Gouania willdenowi TaxID=441366 RepID=A0A8C5N7N1_GOUWI|nr:cytochrome b561 domain-containing protein 1-like [Gouania willdenowi]
MRSDVEYSPVGPGPRDHRVYVWLRRAAVLGAHVTGLGLTVFFSVLSRPGTSLFSWHPVCMSAAYCLCLTEGVLLVSPDAPLVCFKSRTMKLLLHWFFQALVLIAGSTGLCFMVASKNVSEHPHLTSWHSVMGVATLAVNVLQALCGVGVAFSTPLRLSASLPKLKLYHATCGLVLHLLATVTVTTAMFSDWFQAIVRGPVWWLLLFLPLFPGLVVMNQITSAFLSRKRTSL